MRRLIFLTATIIGSATQLAWAQSLNDAAVEAAIKAATAKKYAWDIPGTAFCSAGVGFGGNFAASMAGGVQPTGNYSVLLARAAGRVGFAAQQAKRLYKKFGPADVTQDLRDDSVVSVILEPNKPTLRQNTYDVASPLEHMVIRTKGTPTALQPTGFAITPVEWGNLMGGRVQGTNATATFPLGAVRELPPGDLEIVLVTQAGERKCKISAKDRAKVF